MQTVCCVNRTLWIAALLGCGACQRYVELGSVPSALEGDVRLTLLDDRSGISYGAIGSSVRQVEGTVLSASDSAISLSVTDVTRANGFDESWPGETVTIPRQDVAAVEGKRLSFPRTLATIGAVVAGSFVARGAINGAEGSGSGVRKPNGSN